MLSRKLFLALAMLMLNLSLANAAPAPVAKLSSAQATAIALRFCKQAGLPVTEDAVTRFSAPTVSEETPTRWQASWQVAFGKRFSLYVLDASGAICSFADASSYEDSGVYKRRVASDSDRLPIAQDEAVRRAISTLKSMGWQNITEPDVWALDSVGVNHSVASDRDCDVWEMTWHRIYQGIPCRDEFAAVTLQAQTGELESAGVGSTVPALKLLPHRALLAINMQQAVETAFLKITDLRILAPVLTDVFTEVLRPNAFFEPDGALATGGSEKKEAAYLRPAWKCRFEFVHPRFGPCDIEAYIDSQTGRIIGGAISGQRWRKTPSAGQALQSAQEFRLYRRGKTGSWPSQPTAVLKATDPGDAFQQLQQTSGFAKASFRPLGDIRIVAVTANEPTCEFNLDTHTGHFGSKDQWCTLPADLRTQLQSLPTASAKTARIR